MEVFSYMEKRKVNLDEVFSTTNVSRNLDLESLMRKLGHNMEKKVSLLWDICTFETYLNENIVPRRLRWDVPPNDGLTDPESNEEWFKFFNDKGLELLTFLLERKQRKNKKIDQNILEIREELELYKDTTEFKNLTTQLNKDLVKKDKKVQQRKSKKHIRDRNDFRNNQVFKWQSQIGKSDIGSTYYTPEKTVRVYSQQANGTPGPDTPYLGYQAPRDGGEGPTPKNTDYGERNTDYHQHTPHRGERRPQYYNRTPQNGRKRPYYWKNSRKPPYRNNRQRPPHEQRDQRGPPYDYRDQRRTTYDQRENRAPPYDYHRPRERSPFQDYGQGQRTGSQQNHYRQHE